jgi:hypothetical protein
MIVGRFQRGNIIRGLRRRGGRKTGKKEMGNGDGATRRRGDREMGKLGEK